MIAGTSSPISSTGTQFQAQPQTHTLSARVRKTIQSIKEIIGDFSDADIYMSLKESNMDPNEATQKLLNQDPFHEVKRKRDKKKENTGYKSPVDVKKQPENTGQGMKPRAISDRNARRGGYARTSLASNGGISREFRVVRDNRVNHNADNLKPVFLQAPTSSNERGVANLVEKGLTGTSSYVKHSDARSSYEFSNGHHNLQARHARDVNASVNERKIVSEEKQNVISNAASGLQVVKPSNSQHHPAALASSNSVVGVYSSSTDPVHVPSPESRPSAAVGAIKREVGVVGGRRQSFETAVKDISASVGSFSNSVLGRDGSVSESFRPFPAVSKTNQVGQTSATEPVMPSITVSRSFLSNQYNSRPHQTVVHQKAPQQNKEWKPKSNQKSNAIIPGVIGTPTKSNSPSADNCKESESDAADLQDKLSRVSIHGNQNVIIAEHIRVPENDRCKLTFGSLGLEFDSSKNFVSEFQSGGVAEESNGESAESNAGGSFNVSAKESSDEASGSKQTDLLDDKVRNSESDSPASVMVSENPLPDNPSSPPNLDSYSEIGLVHDNSPSYAPSEPQQQPGHPEMSSFSGYDSQTGYDISYFRPPIDEAIRGQGLPSPQEALTQHTANGISASSVPMMQQQQQPPMAQMYQQVHVSHFPNIMPYRQFLSPVYVPQMAMPGYSSNPAYPHPSNGNSYLLMPGGGSHLSANGLKYGIQQFKPVPANNPGFGNFTSPPGYAINPPGVVGNATGLEDSSRIKYKEGSLYVPNPQAETSDLWIQNPRELSGLQSAPYYNVPGQTPHPTYLPSHAAGHTSFNAAAAQSQHMQFQGLYPPPPQPAAMASPHHLGPVMGGNVGVGVAPAAPGAQVGAYQPQLGHLSWTSNF